MDPLQKQKKRGGPLIFSEARRGENQTPTYGGEKKTGTVPPSMLKKKKKEFSVAGGKREG